MKTPRLSRVRAGNAGNRRRPGAVAVFLVIAFGFVPEHAPSASDPEIPPAYLSPPSVSWSADQLTAYAAASAAVQREVEAFVERYARAGQDRKKVALMAANEAAIRAAIKDAGLTFANFDAIDRAVQGDPRLHARVQRLSEVPDR